MEQVSPLIHYTQLPFATHAFYSVAVRDALSLRSLITTFAITGAAAPASNNTLPQKKKLFIAIHDVTDWGRFKDPGYRCERSSH